jgi:A/G-specific adenine glycosylase
MPEMIPRAQFVKKLLAWYRHHARDLPWRRTKDPYKIWISEVMLQQTTVKAVAGYYARWCRRFPTVKVLARANLEAVLKAWQGLGYYARARNLHQTARILVEKYDGKIPQDPDILGALPGLGPYTTGAVLSIAYGQPRPIVDANIRRVFQRLLAIRKLPAAFDVKLSGILMNLIPAGNAGDFNQALMELGALVCRSKEPTCNVCPVSRFCQAYKQDIQEIIPEPKASNTSQIHAVVAVIRQKDKILIQQRAAKGLLAGLWEFPGGKVQASDKTTQEALKRELSEELGQLCRVGRHLGRVRHYYTQFRVDLEVYEAFLNKITVGESVRWVLPKDLVDKYPMPSGSAKIVRNILQIK